MCGIAGFAGENRDRIERMTSALSHRGPDGMQHHVGNGVSLGHARLAILDPRPEGNQPMWNDRKTVVIVYNGEIFNYRELKEKEALDCKTGTDTEVLLKLYEKYGMDFLPRLRGMYAFGLYDTAKNTWFLARDPGGIKPLFLSYPEGKLHFASEMRSLLKAFSQKPALNWVSMSHFLRLQYVPGPATMCEGIESLPPGTLLIWKDGRETRSPIVPDVAPMQYASPAAFRETFPSLMDEVVKEHLVSDRPVGMYLSGGIDSSVILHHMCKHAAKPVKTFTVRFDATAEEGEERFNTDAELAKKTAEYYGTDHHEVLLTAELCREIYKDTARALDQPNADAVAPAQVLLSRAAKKEVDVVLLGSGGDELFGGYPRYRVARILRSLRWIPGPLRGQLGGIVGAKSDVLRMAPGAALAERLLARPLSEANQIVRGTWFDRSATTQLFASRYPLAASRDPIRDFMEFDRSLWLVDESLRLADATTMSSGVEGRVPFIDPRIIAASHGTESEWHVTWNRTKALLKDTYYPVLPKHLQSLAKASFYPPLSKWLRREAAPLVEETLAHPRIREFFDVTAVRELFERHKRKETYALHTLSSLTQLRCWFETVYDAS